MTDREIMQQALEALQSSVPPTYDGFLSHCKAMNHIRIRLAQPEQEPADMLRAEVDRVIAAKAYLKNLKAQLAQPEQPTELEWWKARALQAERLVEKFGQPEQEPVAWIDEIIEDIHSLYDSEMIKELAEQAHCYACEYAQRPDYNPHNPYNQLIYKKRYDSKFAELIVRKCIQVCNSRVGNIDYNTGRTHCASDEDRALQALAQPEQESERNKLAAWMMQRSYATGHGDTVDDLLKELEWQVIEREREACAKVCERWGKDVRVETWDMAADDCAAAIRARGNA